MDFDQNVVQLIASSRDKFRTLVDGIEDAVMSIDPDYRIVTLNVALADALRMHPRDIVGRRCHEVLYGTEASCGDLGRGCPAEKARLSNDVEVVYHSLPFRPDGDPGNPENDTFIEVRAMPMPPHPEGGDDVILLRRDVTLQKRAEIQLTRQKEWLESEVAKRTAQLVEANEELQEQRDELADANAELITLQNLKEDLTNMVVHDLKGPLAEIQANLEMMSMEELSELQAEFVESAGLGADDLLRMITNLLDVSRLEENRLILELEEFEARAVMQASVDRFTPLAKLNSVTLKIEAPGDLPLLVADRRLIERVLNNLISNALDYTPVDGRVTVGASFGEDRFRFEVRDTGRGVPPEMRESIFEKFSQGQEGRPKTSSGLGLTFCRMAVEAHGGRTWVESELDRGSRFLFTLPDKRLIGEEDDGLYD